MIKFRAMQLESVEEFKHTCVCGAKKHMITAAKVDAAQFFKAASVARGTERIKSLLTRLTQKTKTNAVALERVAKA